MAVIAFHYKVLAIISFVRKSEAAFGRNPITTIQVGSGALANCRFKVCKWNSLEEQHLITYSYHTAEEGIVSDG